MKELVRLWLHQRIFQNLPKQNSLSQETSGLSRKKVSLNPRLCWLITLSKLVEVKQKLIAAMQFKNKTLLSGQTFVKETLF